MVDFLLGVPGKLKTLLDRLTATRAANLDDLDTTVSSRAPSSTAVSNLVLTAAKIAHIDAPISDIPLSQIKSFQQAYYQRVTMIIGTAGTQYEAYYDISISAVDTSKTRLDLVGSASRTSSISSYADSQLIIGAVLLTSTSIRVFILGAPLGYGANNHYASFYITMTEYN